MRQGNMKEPLFILCPGRSFSSVVCSALGQHPQMYGLPELNLFLKESIRELNEIAVGKSGKMRGVVHGLLRVLAQLHGGNQTKKTVADAWNWLREHGHWTTAEMFYYIQGKVHPQICVDKSPSYGLRVKTLNRIHSSFPNAYFLHLSRHPRSTCKSFVRIYSKKGAAGKTMNRPYKRRLLERPDWHRQVESHWHHLHHNILEFREQLSTGQSMFLQGEEFLSNPHLYLHQIAEWLDLRTDNMAIEAMMHPENSPYAFFGPADARFGNNAGFLENPTLRTGKPPKQNLEEPLEWLPGDIGFSDKTKALARLLGYD